MKLSYSFLNKEYSTFMQEKYSTFFILRGRLPINIPQKVHRQSQISRYSFKPQLKLNFEINNMLVSIFNAHIYRTTQNLKEINTTIKFLN